MLRCTTPPIGKLVVMSFPAMLREMLRAVFKRRVLSKEKEAL